MGNKKQVTVGVIGAGMISDIYLENMTKNFPILRVKSICARRFEHAKKQADKYGITAVTQEEMLADPEIDMVVILTPVETHYVLIKSALLAGKHVYTEKTMTVDLAEARELVDLAKERGLLLGAAPDTFLGEAYQTVRKALDDGMIGQITSFSLAINRSNDLILALFPNNRVPGNGVLFDYGVYYLTALISLLGPVDEAVGITQNPIPSRVNEVPIARDFGETIDCPNESVVDAILKLKSGITGTFHINTESAATDQAYFAIFGRDGILYCTDANQFRGEVKYVPKLGDFRHPKPPKTLIPTAHSLDNARGIGPADMAEAIVSGQKCRPSGDMAYHVLEVLTAIRDSEGQMVKINSSCDQPAVVPSQNPGIRALAHTAFNMKNEEAMFRFYCDILGLKKAFTLTYDGLIEGIRKSHPEVLESTDERVRAFAAKLKANAGKPWITYLRLSDNQFVEMFHDGGTCTRTIENRRENYGYTKMNFEVDSIDRIRQILVDGGVTLEEDIHPTLDGATEIVVHDPDGNEVQFTEYTHGRPSSDEPAAHTSVSHVNCITQVALQVKDDINMLRFYTRGLGLKKVKTITAGELADAIAKMPGADQQQIAGMRLMASQPWLDYIEVAPHQYLELFHTLGQAKKEDRDLHDAYGYQHFCMEVGDIHKAWDAVVANGITPDTPIRLGADHTWQFWIVDPDGNRMEFHQYTPESMQVK